MRDLKLMIDRDRDGLVQDRLLLERLPFIDLPALLDANLRRVADLGAVWQVFPRAIPCAIELPDETNGVLEADRAICGYPRWRDEGVRKNTLHSRAFQNTRTG